MLRVYSKRCASKDWRLLFCVNIPLTCPLYVGDDSTNLHSMAPECFAIFIKLDRGLFCVPLPGSLSGEDISRIRKMSQIPSHLKSRRSLTFSQVLKIKSLLKSLTDSDSYRHRTYRELNALLEGEKENGFLKRTILEECIKTSAADLEKRKTELYNRGVELAQKEEVNECKGTALEHSLFRQKEQELKNWRVQFTNKKSHNHSLALELESQRSRIAFKLGQMFPLEPLKNRPFEFGLFDCVVPLPLHIESTNGRAISAVLGLVVLAAKILSKVLAVPLQYRMEYVGSSSYIVEKVSSDDDRLPTTRILPLCFNRKEWASFQHALTLLKRNIAILLLSQGLSSADENNFLGNLKILFLCSVSKGATSNGFADFEEHRIDHIKNHIFEGRAITNQTT